VITVLLDQGFNEDISNGLLRRMPDLVVVTARSVGLEEASDDALIELAADQGWVILTQDVRTFSAFIEARLEAGLPVARTILVPQGVAMGDAIDGVELVLAAGVERDWQVSVVRLPLR
jgi:hypothetical protein